MPALSLALLALVLAGAPARHAEAAVDCARELSEARRLHRDQAAERLAFADPLVRALRTVVDRTLTDEDRALILRFRDGAAGAGELDRRLWPRLRRVFARFNAEACRDRGGVAGASELVDGITALRGGEGLHTGVVVTCARRAAGDARRYLGLRVRPAADGPTLVLHGVVEAPDRALLAPGAAPQLRRLAVAIPLGEREAEETALAAALADYAGRESDFTWMVPAACQQRLTSAGVALP